MLHQGYCYVTFTFLIARPPQTLNFFYFPIFTIFTTQVFTDLRELKELELHFNMISHVAPLAFSGLSKLVSLDMNGNMMTSVPQFSFAHLLSVKELRMSHNMIGEIGRSFFNKGLLILLCREDHLDEVVQMQKVHEKERI